MYDAAQSHVQSLRSRQESRFLPPTEPIVSAFLEMARTEARAIVPELVIQLLTTEYNLNPRTVVQRSTIRAGKVEHVRDW